RWSGPVSLLAMTRVAVEHERIVTIVERLRVDALVRGQLVWLAKSPLCASEREQREQPCKSGPQCGHGFLLKQKDRDEHQRPDRANKRQEETHQAKGKVASAAEAARKRAATQSPNAPQANRHVQRVKASQAPKNRAVRPARLGAEPLGIKTDPKCCLK